MMRSLRFGRTSKYVVLVSILIFLSAAPVAAASPSTIIEGSVNVLMEMNRQDDAKYMADVIEGAHAIAFIPAMYKAGFIIGAEYGEGLILRKEGEKWFGPSFYNMAGGSLGFQIGVQRTAFVFVVNNREGVEAFLKSRAKLGADATVAVGPVGRRADAATDAQLQASIYSYSMSQGLFAGVSLDGAVLSISVEKNREYWGETTSADDALRKPATDERILPLIKEIELLSQKAE